MKETILAFKSDIVDKIIPYEGFCQLNIEAIRPLEDHIWFGPRDFLETTNEYRQLVGYSIIVYNGKILTYDRSYAAKEHRLKNYKSLGFGGHVDILDGQFGDIYSIMLSCYGRELKEELNLNIYDQGAINNSGIVGIIKSNAGEVEKCHLGTVCIFEVFEDIREGINKEEGLINPTWMTPIELSNNIDKFESWSQILIDTDLM